MRTDQQIVDQTNDLARILLSRLIGTGYEVPEGHKFYEAEDPRSQKAWAAAVEVMEFMTQTDANDALANIEPPAPVIHGPMAAIEEQQDMTTTNERRLLDMLSRAYDAFDGEENSVKEEHADLIEEMSGLLDELNQTAPKEPVDHVYTFDLELYTTISVTAPNRSAARNLLQEHVNGTEANLGSWPNGDPILCQVGMPDDAGTLIEIDGESA